MTGKNHVCSSMTFPNGNYGRLCSLCVHLDFKRPWNEVKVGEDNQNDLIRMADASCALCEPTLYANMFGFWLVHFKKK